MQYKYVILIVIKYIKLMIKNFNVFVFTMPQPIGGVKDETNARNTACYHAANTDLHAVIVQR